MAANEINLTIKVSDDGNLKIVGKNAEKAADGLNKAGKSARTADRNLKGASQQSANGTKNFSKMAQGISGSLVPAYATLAANIFAITAAFGFLKESADFRVLQDAQVAFSSATGVGLRSLTADIKEASDGLIGFKESAQAAAIGVAAGLDKNAEAIKGLFNLGVSLVEVGAVTPKIQYGNRKPRVFRLNSDFAIINRLGFNNLGMKKVRSNLKRNIGYIGSLGSKNTHQKRCERLLHLNFNKNDLSKIHGPIGLNIRAKTPAEIAISIMGEIVSFRRQNNDK